MILAIQFGDAFLDRIDGLMVRQQCLKLIDDSGNHKY
jgi:hypothetical protein